MSPAAWSKVKSAELSKIRGVCLDIDETLSTRGKLTSEAYDALWRLKDAGFIVVPITGRPAGWCDHFARFWPVDAVVGENGAFTFFMEKGVRHRLNTPGASNDPRPRIDQLAWKIRQRFPHVRWASDQSYREYDLAIDICEDVPRWPEKDIQALLHLCSEEGAHAKLSSIHVNAWFGDYDKRRGLESWLEQGAPGIPRKRAPKWDELLFIGDSPNDEPMFKSFRYSVGVANLRDYLDRLKHPPVWITEKESGAGFVEMASKLIRAVGNLKKP
jgi:hydroxymethylpyrimidine pyrophosphatase-like HAD family hydrolase